MASVSAVRIHISVPNCISCSARNGADRDAARRTWAGSLPAVWRRARQPAKSTEPEDRAGARQSEIDDELEALAIKSARAADEHWRSIMKTFQGLQARLRELAGAAQASGAALRQGTSAGLERRPADREIPANWQAPLELRPGAPRPGPITAWQALDRAFKALVSALNDPTVTLPNLAQTWEALAKAAGGLADAIDNASVQDRAVCSFCSKPARDVGRLITGPPGVGICNECVQLCVEVLEEEA